MPTPESAGTGSEDGGDDGTAERRLAVVLEATGIRPIGDPTSIESHSNDTWMLEDNQQGNMILRVCWRGDTDRLLREGAVAAALPAEVRYPAMLGFGRIDGPHDLTWTLTRRLDGTALGSAWPTLDERQQREACRQVARMARALHQWRPSRAVCATLVPRALGPDASVSDAIGRSINPLPDGVATLLAGARRSDVDRAVVDEIERYLDRHSDLCPVLDDPTIPIVVHSDLHLENVWWDGRGVTGLLDFEWVRLGPPWVELARITDVADDDEAFGIEQHQVLLRYLREDYPALVDVDRLPERIRFMQVAYQLRALHLWGLTYDEPRAPDHPLRILDRLLDT